MSQPNLTYFEPAFADELAHVMAWSFEHMQADEGGSVYLRLSTRSIEQPVREDDSWIADALQGAYWLRKPAPDSEVAIVYTGAVAPEVLDAWEVLAEDIPGLGLLAVTSADLLHRNWTASRADRWRAASAAASHIERLLSSLSAAAGLVTVVDGSPATLSWLGSVHGMRVSALGVESFGQTGDLPDLYRHYRLDRNAIVEAAAELFVGR